MAPSPGRRAPPSAQELEERNTVGINKETVTNTVSTDFPNHYPGEDHVWDLGTFKRGFRVQFHSNEELDAQFSLIGVDASIANAFRRILLAEIPTLAVENVFVYNNTSVIQDEVLAHRLGLIPFTGSKQGIRDWMTWWRKPAEGEDVYATTFDRNTICLRLRVECTRAATPAAGKDRSRKKAAGPVAAADDDGPEDPRALWRHAHVYARDIEFAPAGEQDRYFGGGDDAIRPVNPDILVAKLRPGQAIDLEMHMHKGRGHDHAKFSPVATASYRLMPTIRILRPILGEDAKKFQACFMEGVVGLDRVTRQEASTPGSGYEGREGDVKAVVADPMRDTVSREVLRHAEFDGKVKLGRRRDHFIFSVESTGQWESDELFLEAVKMLKVKCQRFRSQVTNMVWTA